MAQTASQMSVVAIRVARLTATGAPDYNNPQGGFMMCGGVSKLAWTVEKQTGADIFEFDGAGNGCVVRKRPDIIKRVNWTLTMCRDDYRLSEIISSGQVATILDGTNVVGRGLKAGGGCSAVSFNGVSIEVWGEQWDCGDFAARPFMRKIFPKAIGSPDGYTWENGVAAPVYTGYSQPNNLFGDGPFGDLDLLAGVTGLAMIDIDNDVVPTSYCTTPLNYINIPGSAS